MSVEIKSKDDARSDIDKAARRFGSVINSTGCLQVKRYSANAHGVSYLCSFSNEGKWSKIMTRYLLKESGRPWKSFFAKKYFVKDGSVVAGWSISLKSQDPATTCEVAGAIMLQAKAEVEGSNQVDNGGTVDFTVASDLVEEVVDAPYWGSANRNKPKHKHGRGARPIK